MDCRWLLEEPECGEPDGELASNWADGEEADGDKESTADQVGFFALVAVGPPGASKGTRYGNLDFKDFVVFLLARGMMFK